MVQTALKEMYYGTPCTIATWQRFGTVFKMLLGIGWRIDVFLCYTAILNIQSGLMEHTRQSPKMLWLVQSVIVIWAIAVFVVTTLEWRTVVVIMSMSYKSHLSPLFDIVVTPAPVSCIRNTNWYKQQQQQQQQQNNYNNNDNNSSNSNNNKGKKEGNKKLK